MIARKATTPPFSRSKSTGGQSQPVINFGFANTINPSGLSRLPDRQDCRLIDSKTEKFRLPYNYTSRHTGQPAIQIPFGYRIWSDSISNHQPDQRQSERDSLRGRHFFRRNWDPSLLNSSGTNRHGPLPGWRRERRGFSETLPWFFGDIILHENAATANYNALQVSPETGRVTTRAFPLGANYNLEQGPGDSLTADGNFSSECDD